MAGRRAVDGALSLSADGWAVSPPSLSPPYARVATMRAVVCGDGTWMAPSDVHGQTTRRPEEERDGSSPGRLAASACAGCGNGAQAASSRRPVRFERDHP